MASMSEAGPHGDHIPPHEGWASGLGAILAAPEPGPTWEDLGASDRAMASRLCECLAQIARLEGHKSVGLGQLPLALEPDPQANPGLARVLNGFGGLLESSSKASEVLAESITCDAWGPSMKQAMEDHRLDFSVLTAKLDEHAQGVEDKRQLAAEATSACTNQWHRALSLLNGGVPSPAPPGTMSPDKAARISRAMMRVLEAGRRAMALEEQYRDAAAELTRAEAHAREQLHMSRAKLAEAFRDVIRKYCCFELSRLRTVQYAIEGLMADLNQVDGAALVAEAPLEPRSATADRLSGSLASLARGQFSLGALAEPVMYLAKSFIDLIPLGGLVGTEADWVEPSEESPRKHYEASGVHTTPPEVTDAELNLLEQALAEPDQWEAAIVAPKINNATYRTRALAGLEKCMEGAYANGTRGSIVVPRQLFHNLQAAVAQLVAAAQVQNDLDFGFQVLEFARRVRPLPMSPNEMKGHENAWFADSQPTAHGSPCDGDEFRDTADSDDGILPPPHEVSANDLHGSLAAQLTGRGYWMHQDFWMAYIASLLHEALKQRVTSIASSQHDRRILVGDLVRVLTDALMDTRRKAHPMVRLMKACAIAPVAATTVLERTGDALVLPREFVENLIEVAKREEQ